MKAVPVLVIIFVLTLTAMGSVPQQINYQGYLTRPDGSPLDTVVTMTFGLYQFSTGGTPVWTQIQNPCSVRAGLFAVSLGPLGSNDPTFRPDTCFLGVTVGNNSEMVPRSRLLSVPFALMVGSLDGADGGHVRGSVYIDRMLWADTIRCNNGIQFGDNTWQQSAWDTTSLNNRINAKADSADNATRTWVLAQGFGTGGQQYADTNSYDATRTWVQSMGYLRGENNVASVGSFVGGGNYNKARGAYCVIAGGGSSAPADSNSVTGTSSVIGGGLHNTVSGSDVIIGGGYGNVASQDFTVVSGGHMNSAGGAGAAVGGGDGNYAGGMFAVVAGGNSNVAGGNSAIVSGGGNNVAPGDYAIVGGGSYNRARGAYSVIAGGGWSTIADSNSAQGAYSVISGGRANLAGDLGNVIGGGYGNHTSGQESAVGGGYGNVASDANATVGGGWYNTASLYGATVGGGEYNTANNALGTVGGGNGNVASGSHATVSGGGSNTSSGSYATVSGGFSNISSGSYATIPGGYSCSANGNNSFAAGYRAHATHANSFVWADGTANDYSSDGVNSFNVRAFGGVKMYTSASGGAQLPSGATAWIAISDSTKKTDIRPVDVSAVLDRIAQLPIKEWRYKEQPDPTIRHIGPMAQDFWNAFHLGEDSLGISTLDPDGVALAAIQELVKRNEKLESELNDLRAQVQTLAAGKKEAK